MKKIICLIEDLNSGGAERQLVGLATLLHKSGHNVEVWTYYPGDFYASQLQEAGVRYRYIARAQSKMRRISTIVGELRKAQPDTLITYLDTACIVGCVAKIFLPKINLVVSERNTTQRLSMRDRVKFFLYRWANHIVPNSHAQADFIGQHFPHLLPKLTCITNFVDTDKFTPKRNKTRNTPLSLLTVARVMPQKNVLRYIEAIKCVVDRGHNIVVDWYGYSGDDYYKECVRMIENCGLQDVFLFYPPTTAIVDIYRSHDVFCLPSLYEGYPNVVCEAMSCGLPIICSNVCDNASIVENGINGFLFNPLSVNDMADTIECAIVSSNLDVMSAVNRVKAVSLFAQDVFLQRYLAII